MADENKLELEIVTPRGRALAVTADEVTAPSVEGEFGVLPGHLPMLAALRTGIVSYKQGGESKRCAVGAGFVEANHDKVLLLTDEYIERPAIDPVVVRTELATVQEDIAKAMTEAAEPTATEATARLKTLIARENWLAAQLELYGDPPPATMRPYEEYGPPPPAAEEDIPQPTEGAGT